MRRNRIRAVALAVALIGWSFVAPRLPSRWHPVPHALVATALAALAGAPLGLRAPAAASGVRWGAVAAAPVALGVAAGAAIPAVRGQMASRDLPSALWRWLTIGIPLGTVWSEEAAYRAALGTVAAQAFGPVGGRVLQSAAFGLSHVVDARGAGSPVIPTVLVTGGAGWIFAWLYERSGSLIAPMLVHLSINESGALGAVAVQRIGSAHDQ
jgi:membrane protease YdiL (CAAX protease family)